MTYFGGGAINLTLLGDGGSGDTTVTVDLLDIVPELSGRNFYGVHVQSYVSLTPSNLTLVSNSVDGTKATFTFSAGIQSVYMTVIPVYVSL